MTSQTIRTYLCFNIEIDKRLPLNMMCYKDTVTVTRLRKTGRSRVIRETYVRVTLSFNGKNRRRLLTVLLIPARIFPLNSASE